MNNVVDNNKDNKNKITCSMSLDKDFYEKFKAFAIEKVLV